MHRSQRDPFFWGGAGLSKKVYIMDLLALVGASLEFEADWKEKLSGPGTIVFFYW